ncbi:tetratricopeptide repeat protein [Bernardetia litoralis DSM 6794]|uniref:Tetratricopeptide repeat protein n=1 Tax=Bernardetia litoralis (strain ATCC 23117 / DSM 6794 / NBRC 15988 / NCIMB 1366 / Fx l1 / Sio-4) TaxID=880071 RepID=I4AIG5_BERLS|nr:tetratricopeptide repeat protein [Bernardetia litoralis]AFM03750.1 tetratricopeptide repeat protein [Bernardetia litoralis DSM 6794]
MKNNFYFIKFLIFNTFLFFIFFALNFAKAQPEVYTKAVQMAQSGKPQDGLNLLKTELDADTQNTELLYYTGFYLEQLKNIPKAVELYKEAIKIDKTNFEANYRLGFLYEKVDSIQQAFDFYKTALLYAPTTPKTEKNTILTRLIFLSDNIKKYDKEALKYANQYLKNEQIDNIPAPVALSLANIFYQNTEYEKAQKLTKSILEKTNSNAYPIQKAAFIYTNCAFRLQDLDGMKTYYARIKDEKLKLELENTAPLYYYNLGYVYFFMYDFDKSLRYLKTALTIKPDYSPAQIFINQVEGRKDDKSDVINFLRRKVEYSKEKNAAYYADLTRLYVHEKRYNEAIKVADSCLRLEPNRHDVYFLEALSNYKTARDKEGINVLKQLFIAFPKLENEDHSKYYFLLGLLYKRSKNYGEAKKAFKQAGRGIFEDAAQWELSKLRE